MPRNGSGSFALPAGNPVTTGTSISSTWSNTTLSDIASALTQSVSKDGQTTMTGNLPMGNNKVTGLADGTLATDAASLGQLADDAGASLLGFLQAGTGAVATTVQAKERLYIDVEDFGAVTGTDSGTAIQTALSSAYVLGIREVRCSKNYLTSTTISIPEGTTLKGLGNRSSFALGAEGTPSSITKISTMAGVAVILDGKRSRMEGIGVYSQVGATGDGIWVRSNYCALERVASNGHTGHGIKVGANSGAYYNCNGFTLRDITASFNTLKGVCIDDEYSVYPASDVNAGTFVGADLRSNGSDGLFAGNSFGNNFMGIIADSNAGYGVYFSTESFKNVFIGGDQDEGNTLGVVYNAGTYNHFLGILSSGFTDVGTFTNMLGYTTNSLNQTQFTGLIDLASGSLKFPATQIASANVNTLDDYEEGTFTPVISSSVAGTGTYTEQIGKYTKIGNRVFFNITLTWTAHTGSGTMQITGLPFTSSAALTSYPVQMLWSNLTFTGVAPVAAVLASGTTIRLYNGPASGAAASQIALDTAATIVIDGSYEAAA